MITTFSGAAVRIEISDAGKFSELQYHLPVAGLADVSGLAEEREQVVGRTGPEDLARLERHLEGRGAEVGEQDVDVVGVDPGLLRRPVEEVLGVVDDVLVERRGRRDEDRHGRLVPPSGPAELLPRRRHRTRVAGEDRRVEPADVHTELEGIRRDDPEDLAVAQAAFDRPSLRRQVAAAVAADPRARPEPLAERLAQPGQQDLDGRSRPPEDDRLAAGPQERQRPAIRQCVGRAARAGRRVDDRWIDQQDVALAGGRTVPVDQA